MHTRGTYAECTAHSSSFKESEGGNFQFLTKGECLLKGDAKPGKGDFCNGDKTKQNVFILNNDLYFDKQLNDDGPNFDFAP